MWQVEGLKEGAMVVVRAVDAAGQVAVSSPGEVKQPKQHFNAQFCLYVLLPSFIWFYHIELTVCLCFSNVNISPDEERRHMALLLLSILGGGFVALGGLLWWLNE